MPTTQFSLSAPVPASPADRSYWLQSTDALDTPAPALAQSISADVAIIGGGLTGLWTAIRIREKNPAQRVVVLEADFCGAGASGRNGGQVHSWFESLDRLASVTDQDEAFRLAKATMDAIEELDELQSSGAVDMDLRLDGWLWTASSRAQEGAWERTLELCAQYGVKPYTELSAAEIARRTGSHASYKGVVETRAGSLHPGKLMRNLKKYAVSKGVEVYEHTPVQWIRPGAQVTLGTPSGTVSAGSALIATNAWASSIPELRKKMYVVDSHVVATEPIADRLDELGWKHGEAICDSQTQVLYYQRTPEGRVVFGRGTGGTAFRDRIGGRFNRNPRWRDETRKELYRVYPSLRDVKIEYDWTGPIDCVPAHVPLFGNLAGHDNLHYAIGWNGTALAQIPACSRIIASMLLGDDDEWGRSKLVNQQSAKTLPPEPFRFVGANIVRAAVARKTAAEIRDEKPGLVSRALVALIPSSTEH
jgi:glycine/D-amino acid oxidase-like deaminating enzyme